MEKISQSVVKMDHAPKMDGSAIYVDDLILEDMLYGKLVRSKWARARIKGVTLPVLPDGYTAVDHKDVTGVNEVSIILKDTPVFASETVEFVGDPVLMLVGPDRDVLEKLAEECVINYEELPPVLDPEQSETAFFEYKYNKGDAEKAFAEADRIIEERLWTGHQEQGYLEPQGLIACPEEHGITIRGSMQCPYYIVNAVSNALGRERQDVRAVQDVTGGGFGGKEAYPSILACQLAVAAQKVGKPVKIVYDRREDIAYTSKRHPSICKYRAAIKDGRLTAIDADVIYNAGAYTTLSAVVLQRGIICANGVYSIDSLRVHGRAVKTNSVPNGAMRGFGGPQTFFAIEMFMDHIARELGEDSVEFKRQYMARQNDATSTNGKHHYPVPLAAMMDRAEELSDYHAKRARYQNQTGRFRRGIGMALDYHGCGFTGSGERDLIKAVVHLHKYADDTVEILSSITDMGQGVKTTFAKIVGDILDIPYDQILFRNPDTSRVPDSGPTVASRSVMVVGNLFMQAAKRLKEEWKSGEEQLIEERFKQPEFMIPFSLDTFQGDAYPTFSWGVNVVEVEVDTLTAVTKVIGVWGLFDVGVPIDLNIVVGQMEGGLLQSIGHGGMEQIGYNDKGVIRNNSFTDYIMPTAMDVPKMVVEIYNNPYDYGPFGAKGAGELPNVGGAPAYAEAMENALATPIYHVPLTQEEVMKILQGGKDA